MAGDDNPSYDAPVDRDKIKGFMARFEEMASDAAIVGVLAIADRAGILRSMQGKGPLTAREVSDDEFNSRYTSEILAALAAAGVLEYRPESQSFMLPDEHAACLTDPDSPYALAGWLDMLPSAMTMVDALASLTRHEGGIPLTSFDERIVNGIDRLNSPGTTILLTRRWLQALPDVVERLEAGARIADVGCGSGAAAVAMAVAYPGSTVVGYDIDERSLERARIRARQAGVANLSFERSPIENLPVEPGFDFITSFDVIHDLPHPVEALSRIQAALKAGGTYLMMEPSAAPDLEDNFNPRGALLLGLSVIYCLPQGLVEGGLGLGTVWGPRRAEELCRSVGFSRFTRLPIDNPYSNFYRVEP
jgi:SAM-dependent methyltransferase